ncbi:UxaA family hydrolase [Maribacter sp. 2307ULW6-5]|uniref:UxaA family hydrolase n=1 Tax=Maribacter sp. 2307ULW6-5 TaxID=3386275 RepID=UPI0039BD0E03
MAIATSNSESAVVQLDTRDTIAVALKDLPKGFVALVNEDKIVLQEFVPQKHKFALFDLSKGDEVYMYGVLVGRAKAAIPKGGAIKVSNLAHATGKYSIQGKNSSWKSPDSTPWKGKTFDGYQREDGKVGTANHWLVIPLVFCENRNVDVLEESLLEALGYQARKDFAVNTHALVQAYKQGATSDELYATPIMYGKEELNKNRLFKNVDGIKFLRHNGGCGGTRQDSELLCNLLAGYITNPNTAGVTVLSLGCQNAQIEMLQKAIAQNNPHYSRPIFYLEQQRSTSERAFIEQAVKDTFTGLVEANKTARMPSPLSKLTLGLECGGSDGFSGLSANPALGYASDLLVALGSSVVLSEFPELNGVEQELINRCADRSSADKFIRLMDEYAKAAISVGSGFENNPSPGNIKDGLITDAMKSAGAAKKGGTSPIREVLDYTEQVTKKGLHLLCTPGNDVESTTGLVGSGCNIIAFTTGLGTPTGNPLAPVIKISSNTALFERMNDMIDFDAGPVITGKKTIKAMGEELLDLIINTASGKVQTKALFNGQNDFIPWKRGISL